MSSLSKTKTGSFIGLLKSKNVAFKSSFVIKAPSENERSKTLKLFFLLSNLFKP